MAKHTFTIGPVEGQGKTEKAAREAAIAEAAEVLRDMHKFPPTVVHYNDHVLTYVVHRSCYGVGWQVDKVGGSCTMVCGSRLDALQSTYCNVAQQAFSAEGAQNVEAIVAWLQQHVDAASVAGFLSWVDWQTKYAQARSQGLDDNQARQRAGGL